MTELSDKRSAAVAWQTAMRLWIPGVAVPQGSKQAFLRPGAKIPQLVDSNKQKLKPWRATVTALAIDEWQGRMSLDEPVRAAFEFVTVRPAAHYGTGRNAEILKPSAPIAPIVKPDVDKLVRAMLDGLTDAGVLRDDSRVVDLHARKVYGPQPGVRVWVQTRSKETTT